MSMSIKLSGVVVILSVYRISLKHTSRTLPLRCFDEDATMLAAMSVMMHAACRQCDSGQ